MKPYVFAIGLVMLVTNGPVIAKSKTTTPKRVNAVFINDFPYRVNGLVLTDSGRGSGFCASNKRTFFTAAHVLFDLDTWTPAPKWVAKANSATLDDVELMQSRGFYRFDSYAELVEAQEDEAAFGKDVALVFGFKDFIKGKPARLSYDGSDDLRSGRRKLITGYPAVDFYTGKNIDGFFLHATGPVRQRYEPASKGSVATTLVSTGPGNSGGPVWTAKNRAAQWTVSGILVGGLPSESEVYVISDETRLLQEAVEPVIAKNPEIPEPIRGVSASSLFFPYTESYTLPNGTTKWSEFSVDVDGFGKFSELKSVKISARFKTSHRGDLQVMLVGPEGESSAVLHNQQGAGQKDLIIQDLDVTENFLGIDPKGDWTLMVRDRLKKDVGVFKSFRLEIAATPLEEPNDTTPEP